MYTKAYIYAFTALFSAWLIALVLAIRDAVKNRRFPDFDLVFASICIPVLLYILFMLIKLDYSMM